MADKDDPPVLLDPKDEPVILALQPNMARQIQLNWTSQICQYSDLCLKESYLAWTYHKQCQMNIECPILKGDICSLAGLELTTKQGNVSICNENVRYSQNLTSSEVIILTFWQTPLASFYMDCYLWCDMQIHLDTAVTDDEYRILHVDTNETNACQNGQCRLRQLFLQC